MGLFISNYELRILILEGHQFHTRDIKLFTSENNRVLLPTGTIPRINICLYINKCYISFEIFDLSLELIYY
jgi:hypothetical protein